MFTFKSIIQSIAGFFVPIVIGLIVANYLFVGGVPKSLASSDVEHTDENSNLNLKHQDDLESNSSFYARVVADKLLDPQDGQYFLVSTVVRFDELPEVGQRENLIAKYESKNFPYYGWALGIHRFETSIRPAVYWKDSQGKGGWFTFNSINLSKRKYYAITLVAKDGEFIQLYAEELNVLQDKEVFNAKEFAVKNPARSSFKGAYSLAKIAAPKSEQNLLFGTYKKRFSAFVSNLLIATPSSLELSTIERQIKGGAETLVGSLKANEIQLWIKDGADHSSFKRALEIQKNEHS